MTYINKFLHGKIFVIFRNRLILFHINVHDTRGNGLSYTNIMLNLKLDQIIFF